jgi:lipoprotein-anchoring transpeptidase ErfK/SrfK
LAAKADPTREEAWLLLGDLAGSEGRLRYYSKALQANPRNITARKRLRQALQYQRQEKSQGVNKLADKIRLGVPFASTIQRKASLRGAMILMALAVILGTAAWTGWSSLPALAGTAAEIFPTHTPQVFLAARANPLTPTPTPTATFTPSPTPTFTPTPTHTPQPPTATPQPVVNRPGYIGSQEFWIEIDLGDQSLTAYRGSEVLRRFDISSGTWATPTVTGAYQVFNMLNYQTMAGTDYYLPDVPYVMYFYKDYAIHGAYWHNNFGVPMSHGCVNMEPSDASWVYQQTGIGTWVIIHY